MCDYSLHHVASRPAEVGDRLVLTQFNNTLTRGFAGESDPNVAVCLRPGTEIAFDTEAEYWHPFARLLPSFRFGKLPGKVARFRQVDLERRDTHHDALEFGDGRIVLLAKLRTGQRATVLQMPIDAILTTVEVAESRPPKRFRHDHVVREVEVSSVRVGSDGRR